MRPNLVAFHSRALTRLTFAAIACRLREAMLKEAARLEAEAGKEPDRPAYLPREREMLIGEFDRAG